MSSSTDTYAFEDVAVFTKVPDWVIYHEGISRTGKDLYEVLRSTTNEKRSRGQVRKLTVDEMCLLMPHVERKVKGVPQKAPVGRATLFRALKSLREHGAITRVNPDETGGAAKWRFEPFPPKGYRGWISGWERMKHILDECGEIKDDEGNRACPACDLGASEEGLTAATRLKNGTRPNNETGGLKVETGGSRDCDGGVSKMRHPSPRSPRSGAVSQSPKKVFKKVSKNPPQEGASLATSQGSPSPDPWLKAEEEETAAPETRPGPPPSAPAPSKEAVQVVGAIAAMKVSGRAAMEAASHVERALSLGHAPDVVQGRLARANWSAVRQPVQFVASQVDLYFGEPPVARRVVRLDASRCPECSETSGLLEDAAGNFIMRCDHAHMAACPECEGSCVRADGRSCGHERSPVSRWNRELACR